MNVTDRHIGAIQQYPAIPLACREEMDQFPDLECYAGRQGKRCKYCGAASQTINTIKPSKADLSPSLSLSVDLAWRPEIREHPHHASPHSPRDRLCILLQAHLSSAQRPLGFFLLLRLFRSSNMLYRPGEVLHRGQPDRRGKAAGDRFGYGRRDWFLAQRRDWKEGRQGYRTDGCLCSRMRLAGNVDGRG